MKIEQQVICKVCERPVTAIYGYIVKHYTPQFEICLGSAKKVEQS